ncbi:outer membrane protein assembly factor [Opitutaceae bacterium EW11]|nr:outer membrane protein assembly factor [Opitutaceae bacterium EW11]
MNGSRRALLLLVVVLGFVLGADAAEPKPSVAKIRVSGLGWLQNRQTRLAIERLWGDKPGPTLNTNQIEDAALFIASVIAPKGFQHPQIEVDAMLANGGREHFTIDLTLQQEPPRWVQAREVAFHVHEGVRFHLENVSITGLRVMSDAAAHDFFFNEVALIRGKAARAYSPERARRSADALESTLRQQGYAEASVKIAKTEQDPKTGKVALQVAVTEGPKWMLSSVRVETKGPELAGVAPIEQRKGIPWSTFRSQDLAQEIRRIYFKDGYPDVRVRVDAKPRPAGSGERPVDVIARVDTGVQVRVGQIVFHGQEKTKESVLRRRVQIDHGDLLDPQELDRARYRLGRLGIFRSVDVTYQPPEGEVRDPVFTVREENPTELSLMGGYGSYEQLRGGAELVRRNLFGRAHEARLTVVQSMKSSRGDLTYTVPEIFGETIDGSVRLFGLQREERAFLRQEYGGTATLKRSFPAISADGTIGYTYQSLRNDQNQLSTYTSDGRQVTVASIDVGLTHDSRDNPLRPRRGYRWALQSELASQGLGGEVNYQRVELSASYHTSWGRGRWVHAGISHGVVTTLGSTDALLPVNKRFYPGGESSIRGYGEGEAAPRGSDGKYIGAKSYILVDLEAEQSLTKNLSFVLFTDLLGESVTLAKYPFDTELISVGAGLRYHTLIGPVRLEYGHNVRKREGDPTGAVQFSIGFPF